MVYELIFLGKDPDSGESFVSHEKEGSKCECLSVLRMYIKNAEKFDFYNTIQIVLLKTSQSMQIAEIFPNRKFIVTTEWLH